MNKTSSSTPTVDELAAEVWEDESPAAARGVSARSRPRLRRVPVGLPGPGWRTETDSLGEISVPSDRYWGAQTQRSLEHFPIGTERMPIGLIHAYALVKQAAAQANADLGVLEEWKAAAIAAACQDIAQGMLDGHFPLSVFQTGSGTHTNANLNEVIANRANQRLGAVVGSRTPIHPSDDVNMSQSTNDTFVTAMHVSAVAIVHELTLPALAQLDEELWEKSNEWATIPKVGRTHLMDATSIAVGQEWSGYASSLDAARRQLIASLHDLYEVALGGTAVGTGLNAPEGFAQRATSYLAEYTGQPFVPAANPFSAQATIDPLVRSHAALKAVAVTVYKIANDLRWMASGPRHGLGEIVVPEMEAGSSMMPGKVNPTQAEATLMACLQVIGLDTVVSMAGAEGNFELNAFRPVAASNYLTSARLLADATRCLGRFLVHDLELADRSTGSGPFLDPVSMASALASQIGYDRAARIARSATKHSRDIADEAVRDGVPASVVAQARQMVSQLGRSA
jgi:fumarate hydratase class II